MFSEFPPLHPVIVHFPVALFLLAGLFGFISLFAKREFWKEVLFKTLVAGAIFAPIAVVTGMIDEQKMNHGEIDPMLMIHKYNGIAIMLVFQILLVWFWLRKKIPGNKEYITWVLCLLLGTGMVLLQGYLGGELVFSKGMGVKPMEESGGGHGNKDNENKKTEMKDMNGKEDTKEGGHDMGHSEKDSKSSDDMTDQKSMKKGKMEMEIKDKTININITIDVPEMDMKKKANMKIMDNTKGKDDMKNMDHSKMDDNKKDGNDMKSMDHSKMNDNNKKGNDMKDMSMSEMEMKSPLDTFKFKDNNPAWQKAKKEK